MKYLWDDPPYRAWFMHKDPTRSGPWGIKGTCGYNCFGFDGRTFLASQESAEEAIRSAGFVPEPADMGTKR